MSTQAVIRTGGKQVVVSQGDVIEVELLYEDRAANSKDARKTRKPGDTVTLDDVLMIVNGGSSTVGTPKGAGASVSAKILKTTKGEKTRAVFVRRRKDSMSTKGHRQNYHQIEITAING